MKNFGMCMRRIIADQIECSLWEQYRCKMDDLSFSSTTKKNFQWDSGMIEHLIDSLLEYKLQISTEISLCNTKSCDH